MGINRVWDGVVKTGKSTVKQEGKSQCDINNIMRKYQKTGILPSMILENPKYGDFSDVPSYHEACEIILKSNEQFNALDNEVRKKFKNDPAEMLAFCSDPANLDEMYKLGLAIKPSISNNDENKNDDKKDEVK